MHVNSFILQCVVVLKPWCVHYVTDCYTVGAVHSLHFAMLYLHTQCDSQHELAAAELFSVSAAYTTSCEQGTQSLSYFV
jgi:hypothetical protein